MIYPLLWMLVSSFRPTDVIFRTPGLWLNDLIVDELHRGLVRPRRSPFGHYIVNSAIVVVGAVVGNLFACSLAAYAFARLKFRLKTLWFAIMLVTIMLPVHVVVVPQYIMFNQLGLGEHLRPAGAAQVPGHRRVLRLLDGAVHPRHPARAGRGGPDRRLRSLADLLPGADAADGAGAGHHGDLHLHLDLERLLHPADLPDGPEIYTVPVALRGFLDATSGSNWGAMFAMSVVTLIPLFLVFLFGQRFLVKGIATTGGK